MSKLRLKQAREVLIRLTEWVEEEEPDNEIQ